MNLVYDILCAVLLFFVLHRGTGHLERSFCVAVVFALHPLNVESVAWISERKNMLSTMFLLLAIWAYGCYALRPSWKRYSLLAACFASGLMAKAMVITLPFALLLLDIWPLCRVKSFSYQPGEDLKTELKFVRNICPELVSEKIPLWDGFGFWERWGPARELSTGGIRLWLTATPMFLCSAFLLLLSGASQIGPINCKFPNTICLQPASLYSLLFLWIPAINCSTGTTAFLYGPTPQK